MMKDELLHLRTLFFLLFLQFVRVELDAQGNLLQIINLKSNISVSFLNQGFYWYQSKELFSKFIE